jgi:putative ABC transport system permease protein
MTIKDILIETQTSLLSNKTRTSLTVLGIVIGIASVIIMLSIGQGAQDSISSSVSSLGSNVLTVRPGGGAARAGAVNNGAGDLVLTVDDATAIAEKLPLAQYVAPSVQSRSQVVAGSKNANIQVIGVTPSYANALSVKIDEGTFITDAQNRSYSKVAVLGPTTKTNLFADEDAIGKKVKINSNTYTVIGVTVAKGGTGFSSPDENIYVPLGTALQYLTGGTTVQNISVTTANASDMTQLQTDITDLLVAKHKISDPTAPGFRILNQADLLSAATSITSIFTILLGSVAGISLVVGGIGIMNMMLTTVRERTREIGLRKAIGAQKSDIQTQFLTEAIIITVSGGVIGILLGYIVSALITYSGVITTSVSLFSVTLSFGVSVFIGIIFGYYPAKKASNLNPIDALRYE